MIFEVGWGGVASVLHCPGAAPTTPTALGGAAVEFLVWYARVALGPGVRKFTQRSKVEPCHWRRLTLVNKLRCATFKTDFSTGFVSVFAQS
jgi:hypothetical protein